MQIFIGDRVCYCFYFIVKNSSSFIQLSLYFHEMVVLWIFRSGTIPHDLPERAVAPPPLKSVNWVYWVSATVPTEKIFTCSESAIETQ